MSNLLLLVITLDFCIPKFMQMFCQITSTMPQHGILLRKVVRYVK